jgi:hypothetical protein
MMPSYRKMEPLWDQKQTAEFLNTTRQVLGNDRSKKQRLPFIRQADGSVRYRPEDVMAAKEAGLFRPKIDRQPYVTADEMSRLLELPSEALAFDRKHHFPPLVPFIVVPNRGEMYLRADVEAVKAKLTPLLARMSKNPSM